MKQVGMPSSEYAGGDAQNETMVRLRRVLAAVDAMEAALVGQLPIQNHDAQAYAVGNPLNSGAVRAALPVEKINTNIQKSAEHVWVSPNLLTPAVQQLTTPEGVSVPTMPVPGADDRIDSLLQDIYTIHDGNQA